MAKKKRAFRCTNCGRNEPKWLGQCPECLEWNTFREIEVRAHGSDRESRRTDTRASTVLRLSEIESEDTSRISTGMTELDRALGGGLMLGSTVLVGGEPGIGKSTLMLQLSGAIATGSVLYVSGEESPSQIRRRAERLGVADRDVSLLCSTRFEDIFDEIERSTPRVVIVDSVQTMVAAEAGTVPGTVNQIKLITHELAAWAHRTNSAVIMVAHVTKEGQIAGPKVVEHLVDAVLIFEQSGSDLRFLRATKNRFGAIEELGIFTMESSGLVELRDTGHAFLGPTGRQRPPGAVAAPCYEGSRVLMVEIQALTVSAKGAVSRTFSERIDNRRVSRVAAVLEKHVGIRFSDQDIYVNVAGGIRIQDVAIDLPLALALFSARTGREITARTSATGELSLAGEVRPVSHRSQRVKAAVEMGYERLVGPRTTETQSADNDSAVYLACGTIADAIRSVFGNLE